MNPLAALSAIQTPDEAQLTTRAQQALRMVESMVIDSPETYSLAADELKAIKAKANTIEDQRTSITGPINKALKAINDLFRGPAALLANAEQIIKGKMLGYQQEQERIAAEERRRAEEAAAAERRRLEEEAAARQREADAEAKRLAEAAQAAAATGDTAAAEQAQRQAETVQQNAALEVAAIQSSAEVITAPVVAAPVVKAVGISTAKTLDFEVQDVGALIQHVAANPQLQSLLRVDEVKLRAYVRGLGMSANLPGVRVFEKKTLRAA